MTRFEDCYTYTMPYERDVGQRVRVCSWARRSRLKTQELPCRSSLARLGMFVAGEMRDPCNTGQNSALVPIGKAGRSFDKVRARCLTKVVEGELRSIFLLDLDFVEADSSNTPLDSCAFYDGTAPAARIYSRGFRRSHFRQRCGQRFASERLLYPPPEPLANGKIQAYCTRYFFTDTSLLSDLKPEMCSTSLCPSSRRWNSRL